MIYQAATIINAQGYNQVVDPLRNLQIGLTRGKPAELLAVPTPGEESTPCTVLIRDCNGDGYYDAADLTASTESLRRLAAQTRPAGDSFGGKGVTAQELLAQGFRVGRWIPGSCDATILMEKDACDPKNGQPVIRLGCHQSLVGLVAMGDGCPRINAVVSQDT